MIIFVPKERHAEACSLLSSLRLTPTWDCIQGTTTFYCSVPSLSPLAKHLLSELGCYFRNEEAMKKHLTNKFNAAKYMVLLLCLCTTSTVSAINPSPQKDKEVVPLFISSPSSFLATDSAKFEAYKAAKKQRVLDARAKKKELQIKAYNLSHGLDENGRPKCGIIDPTYVAAMRREAYQRAGLSFPKKDDPSICPNIRKQLPSTSPNFRN